MDCSFDFLQHVVRDAGSAIDFHHHPSYEVVCYVGGSGTTQIGRTAYAYAPGTFAVIAPYTKHNEIRATETEVLFACFSYEQEGGGLAEGLYPDSDRSVERLLRRMQEELGGKRKLYHVALKGLLLQAVAQIGRALPSVPDASSSEKVRYAKNYMEQYAPEDMNLQDIARNLGYSYDHFRHFFKRETGYSPVQFLIRKRVEKAKELLLHSQKSMTDIAHECGFSNAPQFSMMFSRQTGSSPRAYRANRR